MAALPDMAWSLIWLPEVLKRAGLKVALVDGWENRGRGDMGRVEGVICHHTVGSPNLNMPSLKVLIDGRADLPGPLAQLGLLPGQDAPDASPSPLADLTSKVLRELTDRPVERLPEREALLLGRLLTDAGQRVVGAEGLELAPLLEAQRLRDSLLVLDDRLGGQAVLLLARLGGDVRPGRVGPVEGGVVRTPKLLDALRVERHGFGRVPDLDGQRSEVVR